MVFPVSLSYQPLVPRNIISIYLPHWVNRSGICLCGLLFGHKIFCVPLLPERLSLIRDAPDAVNGYGFRLSRSTPVQILYPGFGQIVPRIMNEAEQKGVTGPHLDPLSTSNAFCDLLRSSRLARLLSCPPGSILQIRMGDRAFIAAHLAADLYRQSVYALGVCHISTSRAVGEKMSSWHKILLGLCCSLCLQRYPASAFNTYSARFPFYSASLSTALMPAPASSAPISSFKRPARICWA